MNESEDEAGRGKVRSKAFDPLQHGVFRAVWFASMASNLGGLIQSVGASWLMTSLTRSAHLVALVQASVTLPIMLLSLFAGAAADSYDRRRIMILNQTFMLVVSLALVAVTWAGLITPWLLLLFTFLIGCGTAMNGPAWQASVGDMVPRKDLAQAVTLNSMGFNIARAVGPAIGGVVVAAMGAAAAFAVNALSYLPLIGVLARWRSPPPASSLPRERFAIALAAGVRYVVMSPAVLTVLARALVFGFGASAVTALMPVVARELVGGGALTYGLLLGAFGAGAVAGALNNARLRSRFSIEMIVRGACVSYAVGAAAMAFVMPLPLMVMALALAGAGWVLALSNINVTIQMSTPRWVVARALSIYQMSAFGGMAAGAWVWGSLADTDGTPTALLVSAGVLAACAALGLILPLADVKDRDLGPLRTWAAPATAVPVDARTGPVVVTIDWRIRERDLPEFLDAMVERRRVRRRDGALNWVLLRDLADPELWVERYHLPTWVDYIRHNNRLTRDDAELPQRLAQLHQGDRLIVRRMIERQPRPAPAGDTSIVEGSAGEPTRYL